MFQLLRARARARLRNRGRLRLRRVVARAHPKSSSPNPPWARPWPCGPPHARGGRRCRRAPPSGAARRRARSPASGPTSTARSRSWTRRRDCWGVVSGQGQSEAQGEGSGSGSGSGSGLGLGVWPWSTLEARRRSRSCWARCPRTLTLLRASCPQPHPGPSAARSSQPRTWPARCNRGRRGRSTTQTRVAEQLPVPRYLPDPSHAGKVDGQTDRQTESWASCIHRNALRAACDGPW
eukprot:scaffold90042_cov66-Phaeocystis_antarctica.AAC.3